MTLSITPETKNSVAMSNEAKDTSLTWDQATFSWDDAQGTWDQPGVVAVAEDKNAVTLSYETKN